MRHPNSSIISRKWPPVGYAFWIHKRMRLMTCWYKFHCSRLKLKVWRPAVVVCAGVIPTSVGRTSAWPGWIGIAAVGGVAFGSAGTAGMWIPGNMRNSGSENTRKE